MLFDQNLSIKLAQIIHLQGGTFTQGIHSFHHIEATIENLFALVLFSFTGVVTKSFISKFREKVCTDGVKL